MAIGGLGISVHTGTQLDAYQENTDDLTLDVSSNRVPFVGSAFIYFDVIPADLVMEYSFEVRGEPVNVNLTYELENIQKNYNEDLYTFRQSHYLTIKKDLFSFSIPFLAKTGLYLGGGINSHNTISPSINLLTKLMNDVTPNELIDAIETNQLDYNISNIMDYADKVNGTHIQAGVQAKLFTFNMFINARYTLLKTQNSQGFSDLSIGLAFGI